MVEEWVSGKLSVVTIDKKKIDSWLFWEM